MYLRCSSDSQEVAHQEASIKDYCKRNNITINKTLKDEGISAFRKDVSARPGMLELIEMAHKGLIDNLVIFESSRISRRFIESQTIIDELTRYNVKIHSVGDNAIINQNELDQLMIAFRSFMNQKASKDTGMRVKSAHELLRKQGKHAAGSVPYGYKLVDGYAIIDEELQPQIITMFEDYISLSSNEVQKKYNIKNRKTLIDRISHPMLEAIVGHDLFARANRVRDSRRCSPGSNTGSLNRSDVLFEGLLYHKECGCRLYLNRDYRSKNKPHNYRCKNCRGLDSVTSKKSFSGTKLDSYLEQQILQILDSLNHDSLIEKYNSRNTKKLSVLAFKQKELMNTHSSKQRALQKAQDKLEACILNDAPDSTIDAVSRMIESIGSELSNVKEQLEAVNKELEEANKHQEYQEELVQNILNAKEIYQEANVAQKKAILQMLINRIEIEDVNKADIYLNI
jgi:DNA invertase Pin-like site-specific DNA recombinase